MKAALRRLQIRERIALRDGAAFALLLDQFRDETRPACLMTRAQSCAAVAMEIFVEPIQIAIVLGRERVAAPLSG